MAKTHVDARAICEELAARSAEALLSKDFESFLSMTQVPTTVETFDGRRQLRTRAEVKETFEGVCDHYARIGATDIVRSVIAAEYVDGTIRGTLECRVLAGQILVRAPFVIYSTYVEEDGAWKVAESSYVCDDAPSYTRALSHGPGARPTASE
ncbi:MAG: hypothetical protein AAFM92_14770 [Pseudomonadota bacterium]